MQGLSMSIDNYTVKYKSLSVAGAYKIYSRDEVRLDAFVGYRYVDFNYDFDDDISGARTNTDFRMSGPNIGLRIVW